MCKMDNITAFLKKEEELPEEEKSILGRSEQFYLLVRPKGYEFLIVGLANS